jgi:SAM-dependent methyltransferase
MQDRFWNNHYQTFSVHEPTEFALYCLEKYFKFDDVVIELGCGNGRDGCAISQSVSRYVGLDACNVAINKFENNIKELDKNIAEKIDVHQGDFTAQNFNELKKDAKRLMIYSRFSLHSINYEEVERLLNNLSEINGIPWVFLIEARTIFDNLYGEGTNIGVHEFKTDHYRRFIDPEIFLSEISSRFNIKYFEVSDGFAPFGNQDPLVMRAAIQQQNK